MRKQIISNKGSVFIEATILIATVALIGAVIQKFVDKKIEKEIQEETSLHTEENCKINHES